MPQYLLSVHSVDGQASAPITDEQMQQFHKQLGMGNLKRLRGRIDPHGPILPPLVDQSTKLRRPALDVN